MNLFDLYRQYYRTETNIEKVWVPKRRYKNPQYQRLANRWYGYKLEGYRVEIVARPTTREVREPIFEPTPVSDFWVSGTSPESLSLKTRSYKLPVVANREFYLAAEWDHLRHRHYLVRRMEADLKRFLCRKVEVV